MTNAATHDATPIADPASLAARLEPVLGEACEGRLSPVRWFRTDWQRGGAATGRAELGGGDDAVEVVVKLPVVLRELTWIRRLQGGDPATGVVPRLYAGGETLGGYDLAWLVIEHFPHGPLGTHWHDDHVARLADAAARFYSAAAAYPVDQPPRREPWSDLLRQAQDSLKINDVPRRQSWRTSIKGLKARLTRLVDEWDARRADEWLHGDLHLANAMSREGLESGSVSLIDLAEVHVGHWVEDAVYLERQLWARPERLKPVGAVKAVAAARRSYGLPVDDSYPRLAAIRRALLAGTAPRFLKSEGDPRYLEACLDRLDAALAELGK